MRITCSKCAEFLDLNRLGLKTICKDCSNEYNRTYLKSYRYSSEQVQKHKCRARANYYLRKGKLVPKPCEKCGKAKVEMHHEDYSKPLDVIWLCRECHLDLHNERNRSEVLEEVKSNNQVSEMQAPDK